MLKTILEKFGMEGNGKITKTKYNTRKIEVNGKTQEIAVVSYRKLLQEFKKSNIKVTEISRKTNEYGTQDLKIEIDGFKITLELDKKEITHSYY